MTIAERSTAPTAAPGRADASRRPLAVGRAPAARAVRLRGVVVEAGGARILGPVDADLPAARVTAVAGASGAGKSTLLEVVAGLRRPGRGSVELPSAALPSVAGPSLDGPSPRAAALGSRAVGFVPQDDIVHRELPLRRTLVHAARLRRPDELRASLERAVDEVLVVLDLAHRAHVRVGDLSGGQRKRASIAVELLARPAVLVLDEPTSGLDPVGADGVLAALSRLADEGITVVFSTHRPDELARADQIVFLAGRGRIAFAGRPDHTLAHFEVGELAAVYHLLAPAAAADAWIDRNVAPRLSAVAPVDPHVAHRAEGRTRRGAGWFRQFATLARRDLEVTVHNRLTLAVMLGSPILVITMMAVLFPAVGTDRPPAGGAPVLFWMAFAGVFFGLTFGLLQVVGERAVFDRERFAGLPWSAYLVAKVAVLLPVLAVAAAALVGVLWAFDRLPSLGADAIVLVLVTLVLESLAALLLGLAASAAVRDGAQATLALPMLCFPQVLFAGAVVAVGDMAVPGRAISVVLANRWAFDGLRSTVEAGAAGGAVALPVAEWSALALLALAGAVGAAVGLRGRRG